MDIPLEFSMNSRHIDISEKVERLCICDFHDFLMQLTKGVICQEISFDKYFPAAIWSHKPTI